MNQISTFSHSMMVPLIILVLYPTPSVSQCSRDRSRIVRDVVSHSLQAVYRNYSSTMPQSCPFYDKRDVFHLHEAHKTEESYGKWACDYCGKSFYAEVFLDQHLEKRHANYLYMASDSVCLSDHCDIFRCDVIGRRMEPDFWDTALCIEDDMSDLVDKCDRLFASCMPANDTDHNTSLLILGKMKSIVCSSLTCNRYWYTGKLDDSQWKMLLKTFLTVTLIGSSIVYYFLAYHHFYAESIYDRPSQYYVDSYHSTYRDFHPRKSRKRIRRKYNID